LTTRSPPSTTTPPKSPAAPRRCLAALRGKYVFGDLVDGRVFYTNATDMIGGANLAPLFQLRIFNSSGTQTTMRTLLSKANGRIWKVTATRGSAP